MKRKYEAPEVDHIIYHSPAIMNGLGGSVSWFTASGNSGGAGGQVGMDGNEDGWT